MYYKYRKTKNRARYHLGDVLNILYKHAGGSGTKRSPN